MAQSIASSPLSPRRENTIFGHPKGLYVLFLTEMWERMSYYGMRALLMLYMVDYLFIKPDAGRQIFGFDAVKLGLENVFGPLSVQAMSSQIYGLYTGLIFLTPLFGGILADKVIGEKKSVILGGILMSIGHFLMASEALFFVALFFLILGNGAFKPNISTQVGGLYEDGDPRRDRAFTIFYMGINLGAFFSPLVCGTLGQIYGWHYGFGAAGVGMLIGLVVYICGQKYLRQVATLNKERLENAAARPLTRDEWQKVWALVALCALNIVFWGVYEQQGNTMQLWADRNTDWHLIPGVNFEIPSTWFQSFNPFFIFLLAPLLDLFWAFQNRRKKEPSSVTKMAIGCVLLGFAFIVMIFGANAIGDGKGSVWWLVSCIFILTLGELYLSPVGLSLVSKTAPRRIVSMMMGMWFLSSFFGNYLSGYIGTFYNEMSKEGFFMLLSVLGFAAGFAIWTFNRPLKRAFGHEAAPPTPATNDALRLETEKL